MNNKKNLSIAIVGAGVSGIFTAIALQQQGYTDITLYEQTDRIVSLTHTLIYDNYNFDLSTKLIPSMGLTHQGVYPPLLELIKATGVTLIAPPALCFYDFEKQQSMDLPVLMQRYKRTKVVRDFAKAYDLLGQISQCTSLGDITDTGIVLPGENIEAWARRHDIEAFGTFTNYVIDLFNIGPSYLVPAEHVLVSRVHFHAPYLHAILGKSGVRHYFKLFGRNRSESFFNFLNFENKENSYYLIKEGYAEFFRRVVAHYGLNVRYNSHLSRLSAHDKGLDFIINGTEKVSSDNIIFCCPPAAIAAITPHAAMKEMLASIPRAHTIRTWAFEADGWDHKTFGDTGYLVDSTNALALGEKEFKANGELMYITREHAQSDLMASAVYHSDGATEPEALAALERSLHNFGLSLRKIVAYRDFSWPHHLSLEQTKNLWYRDMDTHQGRDGIYYSGECFAGIGVPTILEHARKFTKKYFTPHI